MRLMCPNCDAEYEVDASAIPDSGRDVQCSNCGHAWFQHHPEHEADSAAEAALYDPPPPLSKTGMSQSILPSDLDWQVESDDPEAILDAMGREARESGSDAPNRPSPAPVPPAPVSPVMSERPDSVPKHDIDPEAMRILREEAEFETAQRALEQGRADPTAAPVVARRVARLKGIQPPALNSTVNPAPSSSGARLPQIETVSAALRNDDLLPAAGVTKPKTGRSGLVAVLIIALAATAAYVFSPDLSMRMPSLAKPLAQYVAIVDDMRDQLDILLPQVIAQLQVLLAQAIALGERGIVFIKGWL